MTASPEEKTFLDQLFGKPIAGVSDEDLSRVVFMADEKTLIPPTESVSETTEENPEINPDTANALQAFGVMEMIHPS